MGRILFPLKSMPILTVFWEALRAKFWFFGNSFLIKAFTKKLWRTIIQKIFTSLTFSSRMFWRGARGFRNKSFFKSCPKQIIFKNRLNLLLEAVVLHSTSHYYLCKTRKTRGQSFFLWWGERGTSCRKICNCCGKKFEKLVQANVVER